MRSTLSLFALPILLSLNSCSAQIKHAHTSSERVSGNCGMCEATIETAAFVPGEAEADWDVDAKTARITFDSTRTSLDAVLQRIAQAGYDNERYLAPEAAYAALPGCCQYERSFQRGPVATTSTVADHSGPGHNAPDIAAPQASGEGLGPVFDAYFALKDALVASNATNAQVRANALAAAVSSVKMDALEPPVHAAWMKGMEAIKNTVAVIAGTSDLPAQRQAFAELTGPMSTLVKAMPGSTPIYLDHCPMYEGGADWLSRDKAIANPFYGAQMMTCGSVKETMVK
jgi:copper chaperone CopZ